MTDSNPLSLLVAIKFVDLLATDFSEWEAYKLGLIDIDGKKLRQPKTAAEKRYFRSWYNLVRNIKRSLATVPGGRSRFASYAAAFALLREALGSDPKIEEMIEEALDPRGERFLLEASIYLPLGPGEYFLVEGPSKFLAEEEDESLIFTSSGLAVERTPFGPVYRHIDKDRRIYACSHQIVRL